MVLEKKGMAPRHAKTGLGKGYIRLAKTKALISFAVTAKLIPVFVFAYTKSWFSHDMAQIIIIIIYLHVLCDKSPKYI